MAANIYCAFLFIENEYEKIEYPDLYAFPAPEIKIIYKYFISLQDM